MKSQLKRHNLDDMHQKKADALYKKLKYKPKLSMMADRMKAMVKFFSGQSDMAEQLGVSVSGVKSWGQGTEPGALKIRKLNELTNVSLDWLVFGEIVNNYDYQAEKYWLENYRKFRQASSHSFIALNVYQRICADLDDYAKQKLEKLSGVKVSYESINRQNLDDSAITAIVYDAVRYTMISAEETKWQFPSTLFELDSFATVVTHHLLKDAPKPVEDVIAQWQAKQRDRDKEKKQAS